MIDKQDEVKNEAPKTFDIPEVEIFRAGTWTDSAGRTVTYQEERLANIIAELS